jgi:hypothetical protein
VWSTNLPFWAKSIVLTQDALLVAGGQSLIESAERHGTGKFWIVSRDDGVKQSECELSAAPVLDGMAFAKSGVFVSTIDGSVLCLRSEDRPRLVWPSGRISRSLGQDCGLLCPKAALKVTESRFACCGLQR